MWFHELGPKQWWGGSDAVDAMLRRRFARDLESLGTRPAGEFLSGPRIARAAILLFDQVPRNIHRDTPRAFAWDPLARTLARGAIARGWDRTAPLRERQFVSMPLMHSEAIADQLQSLAVFAKGPAGNLRFARAHYRMIARFGRFPHRNEVLARTSSAAEKRAVAAGFSW